MLTGQRPFSADDVMNLFYQHVSKPVPSLASARPDLKFTPQLEAVVAKSLAKKPQQRYQSIKEFQKELEDACGSSEGRSRKLENLAMDNYSVPGEALTDSGPGSRKGNFNPGSEERVFSDSGSERLTVDAPKATNSQQKLTAASAQQDYQQAVNRLLKSAKRASEPLPAPPQDDAGEDISSWARDVLIRSGDQKTIEPPSQPLESNSPGAFKKTSRSSSQPPLQIPTSPPSDESVKSAPAARASGTEPASRARVPEAPDVTSWAQRVLKRANDPARTDDTESGAGAPANVQTASAPLVIPDVADSKPPSSPDQSWEPTSSQSVPDPVAPKSEPVIPPPAKPEPTESPAYSQSGPKTGKEPGEPTRPVPPKPEPIESSTYLPFEPKKMEEPGQSSRPVAPKPEPTESPAQLQGKHEAGEEPVPPSQPVAPTEPESANTPEPQVQAPPPERPQSPSTEKPSLLSRLKPVDFLKSKAKLAQEAKRNAEPLSDQLESTLSIPSEADSGSFAPINVPEPQAPQLFQPPPMAPVAPEPTAPAMSVSESMEMILAGETANSLAPESRAPSAPEPPAVNRGPWKTPGQVSSQAQTSSTASGAADRPGHDFGTKGYDSTEPETARKDDIKVGQEEATKLPIQPIQSVRQTEEPQPQAAPEVTAPMNGSAQPQPSNFQPPAQSPTQEMGTPPGPPQAEDTHSEEYYKRFEEPIHKGTEALSSFANAVGALFDSAILPKKTAEKVAPDHTPLIKSNENPVYQKPEPKAPVEPPNVPSAPKTTFDPKRFEEPINRGSLGATRFDAEVNRALRPVSEHKLAAFDPDAAAAATGKEQAPEPTGTAPSQPSTPVEIAKSVAAETVPAPTSTAVEPTAAEAPPPLQGKTISLGQDEPVKSAPAPATATESVPSKEATPPPEAPHPLQGKTISLGQDEPVKSAPAQAPPAFPSAVSKEIPPPPSPEPPVVPPPPAMEQAKPQTIEEKPPATPGPEPSSSLEAAASAAPPPAVPPSTQPVPAQSLPEKEELPQVPPPTQETPPLESKQPEVEPVQAMSAPSKPAPEPAKEEIIDVTPPVEPKQPEATPPPPIAPAALLRSRFEKAAAKVTPPADVKTQEEITTTRPGLNVDINALAAASPAEPTPQTSSVPEPEAKPESPEPELAKPELAKPEPATEGEVKDEPPPVKPALDPKRFDQPINRGSEQLSPLAQAVDSALDSVLAKKPPAQAGAQPESGMIDTDRLKAKVASLKAGLANPSKLGQGTTGTTTPTKPGLTAPGPKPASPTPTAANPAAAMAAPPQSTPGPAPSQLSNQAALEPTLLERPSPPAAEKPRGGDDKMSDAVSRLIEAAQRTPDSTIASTTSAKPEALNKKIEAVKKKIEALKAGAQTGDSRANAAPVEKRTPLESRTSNSGLPPGAARPAPLSVDAGAVSDAVNRLLEAQSGAYQTIPKGASAKGSESRISDRGLTEVKRTGVNGPAASQSQVNFSSDAVRAAAELAAMKATRPQGETTDYYAGIKQVEKLDRASMAEKRKQDRAQMRQRSLSGSGGLTKWLLAIIAVGGIAGSVWYMQQQPHPNLHPKSLTVDEMMANEDFEGAVDKLTEQKKKLGGKFTDQDKLTKAIFKLADQAAKSKDYDSAIEALGKIPRKPRGNYRTAQTQIAKYQRLKASSKDQ
jgi:hypothetical protein